VAGGGGGGGGGCRRVVNCNVVNCVNSARIRHHHVLTGYCLKEIHFRVMLTVAVQKCQEVS
jgi:hypothetical protein